MKQRRKRRRITIRTEEFLTVRSGVELTDATCPVCGTTVPLFTPAGQHAEAIGAGIEPPTDAEPPGLLPEICGHDAED